MLPPCTVVHSAYKRTPPLGYNRAEVNRPHYEHYGTRQSMHISTFGLARLSSSGHFSRSRGCGGCSLTPGFQRDLRHLVHLLLLGMMIAGLAAASTAVAQNPPAPQPPKPVVAPAAAAGTGRFAVVLDAAHGGDDGGGQLGSAVAEKAVTLALSVRLRSLLTARGFQVITTREGNVNLDNDARAQIANRASAAACISFHATQSGNGVHLFVSSLGPTTPTRFLAWKTAQSAYVSRSLKLAGSLNSALGHSADPDATETTGISVTLARASLPVPDSMACPAVAVEIAPIRAADHSITTDVTDSQYQIRIVEALAAGLLEWKTESETDPTLSGGRKP
jgi:N-acetylmuramoyl-L-alanine amidase